MITVDIQGADVVRNQLLRLAERGHNLTPLLSSMGEYMTNSTLQNFERSTSPDGERWAANSPVTFARLLGNSHHRQDGRDARLLRAPGRHTDDGRAGADA